jgi:hypothetical protein
MTESFENVSDKDLSKLFAEAAKDAFREAKSLREDIENPKDDNKKLAENLDNFVKTMYEIASKNTDFSALSSSPGLNFASIISDLMKKGMSKQQAVMEARNESRNYISEKYGVDLPKAPDAPVKKSFREKLLEQKSKYSGAGFGR